MKPETVPPRTASSTPASRMRALSDALGTLGEPRSFGKILAVRGDAITLGGCTSWLCIGQRALLRPPGQAPLEAEVVATSATTAARGGIRA